MLDEFLGWFSHDLGIDLGTANTRVFVRGKGVAINEPSVVARHKKTKRILAIGMDAKKMIGKTPASIEAIRPISGGVIADFDAAEAILSSYIKRVHEGGGIFPRVPRPRVIVGIPSGVTEVERRAVQEVVLTSGARKAHLVEESMAAAVGAGLPISGSNGIFIVDIGAGRTEVAVISLGGIVVCRSIKMAGDEMDRGIINFMRLKHALLMGEQTAEEIKIAIGSAYPMRGEGEREKHFVVRGRDLETGLPTSMKVTALSVREAMAGVVNEIISTIKDLIEETPPELVSDIVAKGLILTGGGAKLCGLDKLIAEEVRLPVWVADDPQTCVVRGCGKVWEDEEFLRKIRVVAGLR